MRAAGVRCVYLVHGTFVGDDPTGLACALGRVSPTAADGLRRVSKSLVDRIVGDRGNFTRAYADDFEQALNQTGGEPHIGVRIFNWSGANHHLARADAAVRLLDELMQLEASPPSRVLLWGHSHGGNVFALLSNLLAGGPDDVAPFFEAARCHFRNPLTRCNDVEAWDRVERRLALPERPVVPSPLDFVTFGTPIRYGWTLRDCDRLLHFVHHRSSRTPPDHRAAPPRSLGDFLKGEGGDYTHQVGIAGSNLPPLPLFWRAFWADRRLGRLLQPEYSLCDLWKRLQHGLRVADAGETLLFDYGGPEDRSLRSLTGHLHYTQCKWLPFHADETARRLYT